MLKEKIQNDVLAYIKEEGFLPSITEDDDIVFKKEGILHYVSIADNESSPFYLSFSRGLNIGDNYDKQKAMLIANEVNNYKCIKTKLYDSGVVVVAAEMFLQDVEHFKAVFYRTMSVLNFAMNEFCDEYQK